MGASGEKIKIVVILENDSEEDKKTMEEVWHDQRFEVSLYVGFEEFLEKQSLK